MQPLAFSPPFVVVLSLLFKALSAKPFVYLVGTDNTSCMDFKAVPTCFGPPVPHRGITGYLVEAVPANACLPLKALPATNRTPVESILLIQRYDCPLTTKIYHAQKAGYQATIIHNIYTDLLLSMDFHETSEGIAIPSLFIGGSASKLLRRHLRSGRQIQVNTVIPRDYKDPCWDKVEYTVFDHVGQPYLRFWPGYCTQQAIIHFLKHFGYLIVLGLAFSVAFCLSWAKWQQIHSGIKTKTFQAGDPADLCVICMAEYEAGDRLKILPCTHAYHNTCINTWLLVQPKSEKTCPICKQKVNAAR